MCHFRRCQYLSLYSVGDIITEWTRGRVILASQGKGKGYSIRGKGKGYSIRGKGKGYSTTDHEGPEGE